LGDDKDNGAANEALSMRRAEAVQAYLHNKGLESNRMQVKGYGSSQPVPSTNGNKNDVNNRCVEIIQGR
jgi:OOP family OmpA-OmpF porin